MLQVPSLPSLFKIDSPDLSDSQKPFSQIFNLNFPRLPESLGQQKPTLLEVRLDSCDLSSILLGRKHKPHIYLPKHGVTKNDLIETWRFGHSFF